MQIEALTVDRNHISDPGSRLHGLVDSLQREHGRKRRVAVHLGRDVGEELIGTLVVIAVSMYSAFIQYRQSIPRTLTSKSQVSSHIDRSRADWLAVRQGH